MRKSYPDDEEESEEDDPSDEGSDDEEESEEDDPSDEGSDDEEESEEDDPSDEELSPRPMTAEWIRRIRAGQDPHGEAEWKPTIPALAAKKSAAQRAREEETNRFFDNVYCPRWISNKEKTCWADMIEEEQR